jgi:hypothetical protein
MKFSEKGQTSINSANQLSGVDFRDVIQNAESTHLMEFADELSMDVRTIKKVKKHLR